jgi:hypothetical protein
VDRLGVAQGEHSVESATRLKGASPLEILALEVQARPDLCVERRTGHNGRATNEGFDSIARFAD